MNDDLKPGGGLRVEQLDLRRAFTVAELVALRVRDRSVSTGAKLAADLIAEEIRELRIAWLGNGKSADVARDTYDWLARNSLHTTAHGRGLGEALGLVPAAGREPEPEDGA